MILCLDVGNSHIFGGVFDQDKLLLRFRYPSNQVSTSDQIGIFLKSVFRENSLSPSKVNHIAICSVVPSLDYSLRSACLKYLNTEPFILRAGAKTGLKIIAKNTHEVGTDRIANAIAASNKFTQKNIIIVDFGTATTFCAVSAEHNYLGGPIMPGIRISMEALHRHAALLSPVNILKPKQCLGQTTVHNIQSGLYYGQLGAVREILEKLTREAFHGKDPVLVGTGGFSHLFESEKIFTEIIPDLVLHGLRLALLKNTEGQPSIIHR